MSHDTATFVYARESLDEAKPELRRQNVGAAVEHVRKALRLINEIERAEIASA
jgi:hypothetical protein